METTHEYIIPGVFVKNITFNDEKNIDFDKSDIVVFTGANNSGKSQILRDIYQKFERGGEGYSVVIKDFQSDFIGSVDDLMHGVKQNNQGYFLFGAQYEHLNNINHYWNSRQLHGIIRRFINFLNTEQRLFASNSPSSFDTVSEYPQHPIQTLYLDNDKEKELSSYFHRAFGVDLIVDRGGGSRIPLFVGQKPEKYEGEESVSKSYRERLSKFPQLEQEGDGMRSFASILLDTFTSNYTVTLIDEPEAFLHPPQARLLGKMLAKNTPNDRQLFISTHSEDFLKGLLDANNSNVKIIRINREHNINFMNILNNEQIKEVWKDSILRYSNVLSGLFHSKVILCESDTDCRFYQAMMDSSFSKDEEISPDILFTHCGGKQRLKTVINALKSLNVKIAAIADIDVLNDKTTFKEITDSLEINWNDLEKDWKIIDEYVKQQRAQLNTEEVKKEINEVLGKVSNEVFPREESEKIKKILKNSTAWSKIKEVGKSFFAGKSYSSFNSIDSKCRDKGLYIVPVGELERFYKLNSNHGTKWVNEVLESVNLEDDVELFEARKFIENIISY